MAFSSARCVTGIYVGSARCSSTASAKVLRLPPLPSPRDMLHLYNVRARKQLSQNFLLQQNVTNKFVKSAGRIEGGDVCEVGPGPGSITRSILQHNPRRLLVIEKDSRFLPFLQLLKNVTPDKLHIIMGDVMQLDMTNMFREELRMSWHDKCPNIHIFGNLPFNISTPLIIRWLRDISLRQSAWSFGRVRLTLTFQKEVAERMCAEANAGQRCRLSVMCQNWCDVRCSFVINGSAFVPPPDVDVGVVNLRPKIEPIIKEDFHIVEKVARHMFSYRQKYCLKSAQTLFPEHLKAQKALDMLTLAQVNPETRSYQLTNDEFDRLVKAYKHICDQHPTLYSFNPRAAKDKGFWREEAEDKEAGKLAEVESEMENNNTVVTDTVNDIKL